MTLSSTTDVDETFISFAARAPTIYLLLGAATATRLWSGRPCSGPCPAAAARLAAGTPPGDTAATAAKSLRAVGPRARAPPSRSTAWVFAHHHRRTSRRRTRLPVVTFLRVAVRVFGAGGAREAAPRGFLLARCARVGRRPDGECAEASVQGALGREELGAVLVAWVLAGRGRVWRGVVVDACTEAWVLVRRT